MIRAISTPIGFSRRGPQLIRHMWFAVGAAILLSAGPASAQTKSGQQAQSGVTWDEGSIRIGDSVRIDPRVRVQGDVLLWNDQGPIEDRFSWGSRRVGVDGELFDRVQFQVERAFQDDTDDDTPWRDVFVDVRLNRALQIRGGRFKLPFSLERNTSRDQLDFIERATAVRALSPSRDTGVMVHGRVANRVVEYEAGVFQHADGFDLTEDPNSWSSLGATLAGRLLVDPIRDRDDSPTRDLHFGVSFVRNTIPEGLNGEVGRLFNNERFSERMNVNGQRTRLGAEGMWRGRRVTVKGELLQLTDQRLQQSITGEDLSDLVLRGAYVTGVVRVFGEPGRSGQAVYIAARLDRFTLGSANETDEAFTNPRADNVAPLAKNTWTFGGTWQVHRWVRVQGNLLREVLVDSLGVRDINTEPMWTAVMRFQFSM